MSLSQKDTVENWGLKDLGYWVDNDIAKYNKGYHTQWYITVTFTVKSKIHSHNYAYICITFITYYDILI